MNLAGLVEAAVACEGSADVVDTLSVLSEAIDAEILCYAFDAQSSLFALGGTLALSLPYPNELFLEDPLQRLPLSLAAGPRVVPLTNDVSPREVERSEIYHRFYRPTGLLQLAGVWLTDEPYATPGMTGLLLARNDKRRFGRQELGALEVLTPVYASALRRAKRMALAQQKQRVLSTLIESRSAHPTVLFDSSAAVLWMSKAAERVLPRGVPSELIAFVRAFLSGDKDVTSASARAGGIQCELERLPEHTVLVHLIEERDPALALSKSEVAVLRLLENGLSNREIAHVLSVSIETVRSHAKSVYKKRGVGSRIELLALRRL